MVTKQPDRFERMVRHIAVAEQRGNELGCIYLSGLEIAHILRQYHQAVVELVKESQRKYADEYMSDILSKLKELAK